MDVEAIIHRVDEDIATQQGRVRAAAGRAQEAQRAFAEEEERLTELEQIKKGFVLTIERYSDAIPPADAGGPAPAESPMSEPEPHPWQALTQAEAVIEALAEIGRPATTAEIYEKITGAGRPEGAEQIRSTIGYLNRRAHKINRVDRGLWELPGEAGTEAPAVAGVAVSGNGQANGEVPAWDDL